jgi:hypothetical protein
MLMSIKTSKDNNLKRKLTEELLQGISS